MNKYIQGCRGVFFIISAKMYQQYFFQSPTPTHYSSGGGRGRGRLGLLVQFSPPPHSYGSKGGVPNIYPSPTSGSRAASLVFSSANLSSKSSVCSLAAKGLLCKINKHQPSFHRSLGRVLFKNNRHTTEISFQLVNYAVIYLSLSII